MTQPFELSARPADDIEIDPLQGRTQLRLVEVAVVVDPAANARVKALIIADSVSEGLRRPGAARGEAGYRQGRAGRRVAGGLVERLDDAFAVVPDLVRHLPDDNALQAELIEKFLATAVSGVSR